MSTATDTTASAAATYRARAERVLARLTDQDREAIPSRAVARIVHRALTRAHTVGSRAAAASLNRAGSRFIPWEARLREQVRASRLCMRDARRVLESLGARILSLTIDPATSTAVAVIHASDYRRTVVAYGRPTESWCDGDAPGMVWHHGDGMRVSECTGDWYAREARRLADPRARW